MLPLRCTCGALSGEFAAIPGVGAHGICYCDDCQAYARFLERTDRLDLHGGTEVVQTWPARIRWTSGAEQLRLLRLTPRGLHRWYAGCCRAPLANTMGSARIPFAGLLRSAIIVPDDEVHRLFGGAHGIQGRFAKGGCPPGAASSATPTILFGAAKLLAQGWWTGAHRPSPFFDDAGRPVAEARVLTPAEWRTMRGGVTGRPAFTLTRT